MSDLLPSYLPIYTNKFTPKIFFIRFYPGLGPRLPNPLSMISFILEISQIQDEVLNVWAVETGFRSQPHSQPRLQPRAHNQFRVMASIKTAEIVLPISDTRFISSH